MNRFKKWLSIQKNKNARLIILAGIILFNLLLWLVSSILTYIITPGSFSGAAEALWDTGITWMLDPGFYDATASVPVRLVAITVIIISMITFSGGIIGYVASLFSSIIENAERGKGKLYIFDHILILNWNTKALDLITDYLYDDSVTNVVILSDRDKSEIETLISRKMYEIGEDKNTKAKLNVIVKYGDILSKSDLSDVCIEKARSIIILSSENGDKSPEEADMTTLKAIMLTANIKLDAEQKIIVEACKEETVKIIREKIAKNLGLEKQIIPILPNEMMGRLIAQTLLFPELNNVYDEVFSFQGAEFYSCGETPVGEFMKCHDKCIPIYNHEGRLYVLSDSAQSIVSKRQLPLKDHRKIDIVKKDIRKDRNILIFGRNEKLDYILDSLHLYELDSGSKVTYTLVKGNDAETIDASLKDIKKIDSILILSSEHAVKKDYDSDVLLTLLMIQDIAKTYKADIIIELLDPKNYDIAKNYNIRNTIISNKYVSRIMTQLSKSSDLYYLFLDLLSYDENKENAETYELYTYRVDELFNETSVTFDSPADMINSCYFSSGGAIIVIGMVKNGETIIFEGNLDKTECISLSSADMLVVICK